MEKLQNFLDSPDQWARLSRNAREGAEEFSAGTFAARVEAIYEEQIARRSGGGVAKGVPA